MLYHLHQSAVGLGHFFTLKIALEALSLKNEKSHNGASTLVWEKSHYGADLRKKEKSHKGASFLVRRKVIMV